MLACLVYALEPSGRPRCGKVQGRAQIICCTRLVTVHNRRIDKTERTNLSFTIRPKVDNHGNHVVDRRVCRLVHESRGQCRERQDGEAELEGAVNGGAGDEAERPLESEHEDAEDEVYSLEVGNWFHGAVQGFRKEVPEDLGPEEAFNRSSDLV